jgi:hypothetical protein
MMNSSIRFSFVGAAGRLHHEDVAGAHVLADLDRDLAVGETAHHRAAEFDAQVAWRSPAPAPGWRCR